MMHFSDVPVYLHREAVDFRKAINGLSLIVEGAMTHSIFDGGLFVFCNKKRDKLKVLYWDATGFCLWHKRLEQDKFMWPRKHNDAIINWNKEQLEWLLRGFNVTQITAHKPLKYNAI